MEIVLVRHGKPIAAVQGEKSGRVSSGKYAAWVRAYNNSTLTPSSRPPKGRLACYSQHYSLSSNVKRAIESTEVFTGNKPQQQWEKLKEMDIPRYKLPFKLKPYTWLIISRVLWMLGLRKWSSSRIETFQEAKLRAKDVAHQLIYLAEEKNKLIVFAHGMTNRYVKKELIHNGWLLMSKSSSFWGETCFQKIR
jgi:broad specificity phosphatase PhoE